MLKAFPLTVTFTWMNVEVCKVYEKQDYRCYLYLVHNSTEPAVFLKIFQTPLLLNLFLLTPTSCLLVLFPTQHWTGCILQNTVFPNQTLTHVVSSFSNVLPGLPFRKLPIFEISIFIMFFKTTLNHHTITQFFFGGVYHSLVTWHTLLRSELSFNLFYPPSCIA